LALEELGRGLQMFFQLQERNNLWGCDLLRLPKRSLIGLSTTLAISTRGISLVWPQVRRKVEKFKNPAVFWQPAGIYCINMVTLAHFFSPESFVATYCIMTLSLIMGSKRPLIV
jgi:hypothetical protein